jgi:hypothetical protein
MILLRLFGKYAFDDLAPEALDETKAWHKKNRALKAPLVMSFVVRMSLHRYLSLPNVLMQMVNMLRGRAPGLPLRPVTSEAVIHVNTSSLITRGTLIRDAPSRMSSTPSGAPTNLTETSSFASASP